MTSSTSDFMDHVARKNPGQSEFHQAVDEVAASLVPVLDRRPEYRKAAILERIVEPDREVPSYRAYRHQLGKAHGPPCEQCTWKQRCEGPWSEYPERFGWEEFIPRRDPPPELTSRPG